MRQWMMRRGWLVGAVLVGVVVAATASAQTSSSKTKPKAKTGGGAPNVKVLDVRAKDMQESFLRELTDLARGYEDAGEFERAKWLMEVLLKLNPQFPGVKEKVDQLTEKMLDASEFEVEIDVADDWSRPLAMVFKDRLVRIEASGEYKFTATLPATVNGLPTSDNGADLVSGVPFGALMAVVVTDKTTTGGGGGGNNNNRQNRPFSIGDKHEWKPQNNGYLMLKVNLPRGHKSTGKVKVKLSGAVKVGNP